MVEEADKGVPKIKPPSKSQLLEWIKIAQDIIESKPAMMKKSFLVAGISNASNEQGLIRNDSTYADVMEDVFGDAHMGYIEPRDSSSDEEADPFKDAASDSETGAESCDDPFATDSPDNSETGAESCDDPFATDSSDN